MGREDITAIHRGVQRSEWVAASTEEKRKKKSYFHKSKIALLFDFKVLKWVFKSDSTH